MILAGNKALYHEYIPLCDGFIYSSLPAIEAVVTGIRVMEVDGKKKTRVLLKCANGETVTVTRVDKAQGLFFFSGGNGVSGRARIDKTGFTPEVNSTLSIARFQTVNREGKQCLIIIDVRCS